METELRRTDALGPKYGMWFFLFTELLFFGGLFLFYSTFRYWHPREFHSAALSENLLLGSVNTAVLLTSSFSIALSIAAVKRGKNRLSAALQGATILMGMAFLAIKYFEWGEKFRLGIYPSSPVLLRKDKGEILFYNLYYTMTGIHGLHVLIGICVIAFMLFFTLRKDINRESFSRLDNTGLYWHFVDVVWIYLFPLFYLVT